MPSFIKTLATITCLLALAGTLNANVRCCPGDSRCSGCWMCPGSDLRSCWDRAIAMPPKCESKTDLKEKAECYCLAYAAIAKCWGAGTCCTEYAPTLAAATDLCNLHTYPPDKISESQLEAAVKEAARVADAIWHNDSGVDVPKCTSHIQPYTGGAVITGTATASPPSLPLNDGTVSPPQSSQTTYNKPSYAKPSYRHSDHKYYDAKSHKYYYKKGGQKNQQDEDDDEDEDCDSSKPKHSKRASYTTVDMSARDLHEARLAKRTINCGTDFQNVHYPGPPCESVQKAFDLI